MLDLLAYKNTHVPIKNLIKNGDFSLNDLFWDVDRGTALVEGNELILKSDGTRLEPYVSQVIKGGMVAGNKYYINLSAKATIDVNIRLRIGHVGDQSQLIFAISEEYTKHSGVFKIKSTDQYSSYIYSYSLFKDYEGLENMATYYKNIMIIDLTETFGKGNEPTAEQMDKLLESRFDNGWFDGTKNLFNAKDFMNVYHKKMTELDNAIIALGGGS